MAQTSEITRITTIDCDYVYPRFAAAFLLTHRGRAAFVETNTAHAVPRLLAELAAQGLRPADVDYVIITHVHLDHAGGASTLMRACPNARLLAHPRAARHAIDPARLIAGAQAVYGKDDFARLYGQIDPIEASRVDALEDGARVRLGGAELEFVHVRGHANHHFVVHVPAAGAVFTGDSFGVHYPALQKGTRRFIFPTTSPTDFDPAAARASLRRIVDTGARTAYLTHFGPIGDLPGAAADLDRHLAKSAEWLAHARTLPAGARETWVRRAIDAYYTKELESLGIALTAEEWRVLELDLRLNAAGIAHSAAVAIAAAGDAKP